MILRFNFESAFMNFSFYTRYAIVRENNVKTSIIWTQNSRNDLRLFPQSSVVVIYSHFDVMTFSRQALYWSADIYIQHKVILNAFQI